MKISQLIIELEEFQKTYGDVEVETQIGIDCEDSFGVGVYDLQFHNGKLQLQPDKWGSQGGTS